MRSATASTSPIPRNAICSKRPEARIAWLNPRNDPKRHIKQREAARDRRAESHAARLSSGTPPLARRCYGPMVNSEGIMSENLNTGDLIDMMGARFEMVARMGANHNDTVLFRTRMAPGKLVPLHSHIDPNASMSSTVRSRCLSLTMRQSGEWSELDRAFCLQTA
jgi:hypothetical protein